MRGLHAHLQFRKELTWHVIKAFIVRYYFKRPDQSLLTAHGTLLGDRGPTTGAVYIRWGRTSCPAGAQLLYKGETSWETQGKVRCSVQRKHDGILNLCVSVAFPQKGYNGDTRAHGCTKFLHMIAHFCKVSVYGHLFILFSRRLLNGNVTKTCLYCFRDDQLNGNGSY